MSLGLGLGHTKKWDKDALTFNAFYMNLEPYNALIPDRNSWNKFPESVSGEAVYRHSTENGLLKLYSAYEYLKFDVLQKNINFDAPVRFDLSNYNWYTNVSYETSAGEHFHLHTGISYSHSKADIFTIVTDLTDLENAFHAKAKVSHSFNGAFELSYGLEHIHKEFSEEGVANQTQHFSYQFTDDRSSAFAEGDLKFSNDLAAKFGLRANYNNMFKETTLAPRISLAYRFTKNAQLSLAYGRFYQTGQNEELKFNPDLKSQKASHYIANFQYKKKNRLLRAEAYFKDYDNLWQYDIRLDRPAGNFNNAGFGYARGFDLFWKDTRTVKNLQYWLSYSYLDSERKYKEYPVAVMPDYATRHNISLVTKYWVDKWRSQIGMTYSMASGRPYNNPNVDTFMSERTKGYHGLSVNWSYLLSQQKILFFSASNVLGINNVFGYDYARVPDANGVYKRQAVVPNAKSFFFVGFFWTISEDKTKNQLDNL